VGIQILVGHFTSDGKLGQPPLLPTGCLLERITERGLAILLAHLRKRPLHKHIPIGLASSTSRLPSLALLA
jgi:hypothetical protein